MSASPERMRFGPLIEWLVSEGLSETYVRKLISQKIIKGVLFPGDKRHYYLRSQVQRDVLDRGIVVEDVA